jgi:predicted amidohydrolase YtcJ
MPRTSSAQIRLVLALAAALATGACKFDTSREPHLAEQDADSPLPTTADMIVRGGRIYTVDENRPVVEALAIGNGRILFAGSERGAALFHGANTEIVELQGNTVIPGMIDSHAHLMNLGRSLRNVNLVGAASYDEMITRVAARAAEAPAGSWILGRGWDQNTWPGQQFPTHEALSRAVPDHPVVLTRVDGHATLVNAAAMRAAGLTSAATDPEGGKILRTTGGEPTGVLIDRAMPLVGDSVPVPSREELRAAAVAALRETARWGLTGLHDAGVPPDLVDLYEEMARAGEFNLRNYVMIESDDASLDRWLPGGPRDALEDGRIWVRAIKIHGDGALGSRGAAMIEPYSDDPGNRGLVTTTGERIQHVAERALRAGFQLNVHEIGDRGNRIALDAIEAALREVPVADHRFRIEHAQVIDSADIPRFAKLDVIPAMQAIHQPSDMRWATDRVGPRRIRGAYAWRALLETGVIIPNGSDFPVEAVNPLLSFHASITRQDATGWPAGGWHPEQRMTREEALKSMTIWPAYASFQERLVGSLKPGLLADFVILDRDIMTVRPEAIIGTEVIATYLAGVPIYQRPNR